MSAPAVDATLVCRGCGITEEARAEMLRDNPRSANCCPERAMNEAINERHGRPHLVRRDSLDAD